jgi:hypothetical protein
MNSPVAGGAGGESLSQKYVENGKVGDPVNILSPFNPEVGTSS